MKTDDCFIIYVRQMESVYRWPRRRRGNAVNVDNGRSSINVSQSFVTLTLDEQTAEISPRPRPWHMSCLKLTRAISRVGVRSFVRIYIYLRVKIAKVDAHGDRAQLCFESSQRNHRCRHLRQNRAQLYYACANGAFEYSFEYGISSNLLRYLTLSRNCISLKFSVLCTTKAALHLSCHSQEASDSVNGQQ